MRLLIDAGNTRIKWAVVNGEEWLHSGALPVELVAELPARTGSLSEIRQTWVSNVAGEEVARHILNLGVGETNFITAQESQCGVRNGYADAAQLGSDRWAALIAAWHLSRVECLVVNCGTATTIDALSERGEFLGGLIMPGVELMRRGLAEATNLLIAGRGDYAPFPQNTADALFSGAIQASCGAIERQLALLENYESPVILSGGAAGILQPHLGMLTNNVDNLVLQGLLLIAQETSAR